MGALLGALIHNAFFVVLNALLIIANWYSGEAHRKIEDEILLLEFKMKLIEEAEGKETPKE